MKKTLKALVLALAALCCMFGLFACDAFACGPVANAKQIVHVDYFGQSTLTIQVAVRNYQNAGHVQYFDFDGSIADFKGIVDAQSGSNVGLETQSFNGILLLTQRVGDKLSYFAVKFLSGLSGTESRYVISDLYAQFDGAGFLFPYHRMTEDLAVGSNIHGDLLYKFSSEDNNEYAVGASYEELKAFYAALNRPEYVFDDTAHSISDGKVLLTVLADGKIRIEKL